MGSGRIIQRAKIWRFLGNGVTLRPVLWTTVPTEWASIAPPPTDANTWDTPGKHKDKNTGHMKPLLTLLLTLLTAHASAATFDDIRQALERSSLSQLQEKVYIHTDNPCYFIGDTLWYKAYVVRADSLMPTPLSKILHVELLSPDGIVVERQRIVVARSGFSCGQFVLDHLPYAGYYELRAYTRWMLNFGAKPMKFTSWDSWAFYNRQMARDYYTQYDGLFSRVMPIYNKPETQGDFSYKGMTQRPYARLPKEPKERLRIKFFPEGGNLVEGRPTVVAFEAVDEHGEAQDVSGVVNNDAQGRPVSLKAEYMGRGAFAFTPGQRRGEAVVEWRGKTYRFDLPKASKQGVTLRLEEGGRLHLAGNVAVPLGVSVLSGGALRHFQTVDLDASGQADLTLPLDKVPTGVADVTVFTEQGNILADRLCFVNHHDHDQDTLTLAQPLKLTYEPYEPIHLALQLPKAAAGSRFSIAVRDSRTEEHSFYNGNVMTELLLSSEIRGFVANPAHYFEKDDAQHRRHLDLLMMVQGWRRYPWRQHASGNVALRYAPETQFSIEGCVYKTLDVADVEQEEVLQWQNSVALLKHDMQEPQEEANPFADATGTEEAFVTVDPTATATDNFSNGNGGFANGSALTFGAVGDANTHVGVNHGNLKREVIVEAEVALNGQVYGSTMTTVDKGRFKFNLPAFYGDAYLNIKAYKEKDSLKKAMTSRKDKYVMQEDEWPDFYVKLDFNHPAQPQPYDFYQKNQLDIPTNVDWEDMSDLHMENDVHQLHSYTVRGRKLGRRKIDYEWPVYECDAYQLYNEMTDRGLSWGKLDMRQFPVQAARLLYGNMGRLNRMFNVDGVIDSFIYYRNYVPNPTYYVPIYNPDAPLAPHGNRFSPNKLLQTLKLKRIDKVRVFSDYEPRNPDSLTETSAYVADATVELVPIEDDGTQVTFRDRHILLHGFDAPAEFYQPDYSNLKLPATSSEGLPPDYRRTLYWNPNAQADEEGRFSATFYNNNKQTRLKLSAAGVTPGGMLLHMER